MGYKFQFVTLAGFHTLNHSMYSLANDYRERALISIQDAINSIQAILQVKDVNTFVGVDRNPCARS